MAIFSLVNLPSRRCLGGTGSSLIFLLVFVSLLSAQTKPEVEIDRHFPCNLYSLQEPVVFQASLSGFPAPIGEVTAVVKDYWGTEMWKKIIPVEMKAGEVPKVKLEIGRLPQGYYELELQATSHDAGGQLSEGGAKASFGVAEFVNRSAKEVRDGGYAFGLKWWNGVVHKREDEEAMVKLGLQWTRVVQDQGGDLTTAQMVAEFPMNAVIKVERFPKELYDEQRYGPIGTWEAKYGEGAWTIKTLPKKEPYQAWLHQQLLAIPQEQNVFEIWNEPWDDMSPEDFATLSQWIAEVVLKDRPHAILGPNFIGSSSPYEYDALVIKAGGLKGMKMVALHPYGAAEDRAWLRTYRDWLKTQTGIDMDIYVTEFGAHSTPAGPAMMSEQEQARRVVRQALSLYSEGVKAFMPHWLGQSEHNPTYIEDWFGFLRKNEQPKPVLLAYANAARLVDGTRYVGDLWYGPKVEAMLFERKGTYTLALWTLGDPLTSADRPPEKKIEIDPGVAEATIVDIIGREKKVAVSEGKLALTLTESPIYLAGVSPDLEKKASKELRADRWPKPERAPRLVRTAHKLSAPLVLDGKFDDWKGMTEIALLNPKVSGADASGFGYLAWDDQYLYVGVDIRDNEVLNVKPRGKLYLQDSLEVFVSTDPRNESSGYGPHDHQYFITPNSAEGKPIVGEVVDRQAGEVRDLAGAKSFVGKTDKGWAAEVAIPWTSLTGFTPGVKAKVALNMRLNDADTSHPRFKIDPVDQASEPADPTTWPLLQLND